MLRKNVFLWVLFSCSLFFNINLYAQEIELHPFKEKGLLEKVDPDYAHASPEAYEAWMDRKFGMRIHWGVYSQLGLDASWPTVNASEEFKEIYSTLWQVFNPVEFDAEEWAQLAEDAGMKYFVFTSKHHDGFSMFDTKTTVNVKMREPTRKVRGLGPVIDTTLHYSIMETPYKQDIVKKLIDAFRARNMGIGLYYSNTDWNDINQRFELRHMQYDPEYTRELNPEGYKKAVERQTEQLRELSTNYGKIDMFGFDHGWPESLLDETVKIVKMIRRLQPDALFRHRGIGAYGDYQTPEHWLPTGPDDPRLNKPWQTIARFGTRWAWQPNDTYNDKEWILESLIDCASKGGNFMIGISPMHTGQFDRRTQEDLRWIGEWLKINGEAIYSTRGMYVDDDNFKFTRSKDSTTVYAIHRGWKTGKVLIHNISEVQKISIIGSNHNISWKQVGVNLELTIPDSLEPPSEFAFVLKILLHKPQNFDAP